MRDNGDWEGWLRFFLAGIGKVCDQAADTARNILQMREEHRNFITQSLGFSAPSGLRVLESMYERPIISAGEVKTITGTSFAAANNLVAKLVELELLREITGNTRNRRFRYEPYVRLFEEN